MIFRSCTVDELDRAPNKDEIAAAYADEGSLPELGAPCPQTDIYRRLEAVGALRMVGAFNGERLVGLICILVTVLPHYGVHAAVSESFFALRSERKSGVGLTLLGKAKQVAKEAGAKALLISAPVGGQLDAVLSRRKRSRHSNNVYVEALA